ncbi:oxygen-independent coproporphyrinogen-3 oxidase [Micromonospora haikouensis]|uniref:Heme chaperone HemW n=1 Tax=Micromonospora haikouensis TaxID=686309 RepID=A0A1C4XHZ3_9ACTN|nr:radical SAM protein [Micromonospora haikouensis]SCF07801.1 oxygen-independent coproporphyrinogen-3 oxidase [Micromonospora haikouensis]
MTGHPGGGDGPAGRLPSARLLAAVAEVVAARTGPPLELYVNIPFCATKCHFCDWVADVPVHRLRTDSTGRRPYLDALCEQIRFYGPVLTRLGYRPHVMYWGGGTPTRLEPDETRRIHQALDESFDLSGLVQWSMETTPNDLTDEKLATMRELGVNRVSIGAQSLDPDQLRRAGRGHDPAQVLAAVDAVRRAGIDNFNIDLISSFPTETDPGALARTLATLLALDPPHVSVYPYRATPRTVMAMQLDRQILRAWDRESMIHSYELAMGMLGDAGYHEYCHGYWVRHARHEDIDGNYKYDLSGDKIGFGSGTESVLGHHLLLNPNADYTGYLAAPREFAHVERFSLHRPQRLTALVGGALMTREGVDYTRLHTLTGLTFADLRRTPHFAAWLALLAECGGRFVEDDTGFRMEVDTIHRAYITHLAYTMTHGLALGRG